MANTSPLQSFIIRTNLSRGAAGRDELPPRPNAPVQDENYNNRSISPLFANQSSSSSSSSTSTSSLPSGSNVNRIVTEPQNPYMLHLCDSYPPPPPPPPHRPPQLINVEYTEPLSLSSSTSTSRILRSNQEFHTNNNNGEISSINTIIRHNQHYDDLNGNVSNRNSVNNNNNNNSSDMLTGGGGGGCPPVRFRGGIPVIAASTQRDVSGRQASVSVMPMPNTRNTVSYSSQQRDRDRRFRSLRTYCPTNGNSTSLDNNHQMSRVVSEVLARTLVRRTRRSLHSTLEEIYRVDTAAPPSINVADRDSNNDEPAEPDNYSSATRRTTIDQDDNTWSNEDIIRPSQLNSLNDSEEELISSDDNINVVEDEDENVHHQDDELEMNDNELEAHLETASATSAVVEQSQGQQQPPPPPPSATTYDEPSSPSSTQHGELTDRQFRQLVLSALECPVCFEYAASPIQCSEGHIICYRCRARLNNCPECRGPFSIIRPRAIERIVNYLELPCSYEGCNRLVDPGSRSSHAKTCLYRSFICPIAPTSCSWTGPKLALFYHVSRLHNQRQHWIINTKLSFTMQRREIGCEKVFIMEAINYLFLVKFMMEFEDKLRCCITILGVDQSCAQNVDVLILVRLTNSPKPFLFMIRSPVTENDEMDMRLEKFATFNVSQLFQNCLPTSSIKVTVLIGKEDINKEMINFCK